MRPLPTRAQERLRDLARAALSELAPGEDWRALADVGVADLALPRSVGGLERPLVDQCLLVEEAGAGLVAITAVRSLLLAADAVGLDALDGDGGNYAERLRNGASQLRVSVDGSTLLITELLSGDQVAEVALDQAVLRRLLDRDRIRTAAYLVGVSRRALGLTLARVSHRRVRGRPLIELQAVAHAVARDSIEVELAQVEVWEAATREGAAGGGHLSLTAAAAAVETALSVCRTTARLHGAAGTSEAEVRAVYAASHAVAARCSQPPRLWEEAADRRAETQSAS